MPTLEDLAHVLRSPAGEPAGALVLLHGPGASDGDLAPLLEVLDPERRLVGVCPRGTMTLPRTAGYRWFVDREPGYPQRDTFEQTYEILGNWLSVLEQATGVPPERTVLGGFSQGAVMAWALTIGPGRPRPAGLLAMSGYIPRVSDFEPDHGALHGLPVAICHGDRDERIDVEFARRARERAEQDGAIVLYRETDVPHILDPRVIPDLIAWVGERFPRA